MKTLRRMMGRANASKKYQDALDYAVRIGGIDTSAVRRVVWDPDLTGNGLNVDDTAYIGSGAFRERDPGFLLHVIQHEVRHSAYSDTPEGHAQIYEADLRDAKRFRLSDYRIREIRRLINTYRAMSQGADP
jgi:hypothetical protein